MAFARDPLSVGSGRADREFSKRTAPRPKQLSLPETAVAAAYETKMTADNFAGRA